MRLVVKNFGPLKDIDIELNKINILIGENGCGKSVLAKLIATLTDTENLTEEGILKNLKQYQINYFIDDTYIKIQDTSNDDFNIEIRDKKILVSQKLKSLAGSIQNTKRIMDVWYDLRDSNFLNLSDKEKINIANKFLKELSPLYDTHSVSNANGGDQLKNNRQFEDMILEGKKVMQEGEELLHAMKTYYIPAERNVISLFSRSLSSLIIAEIPLPKFLLNFASEFEKARSEITELTFLEVKYVNEGKDKIFFNLEDYIELEQSSSGIQSALPLYLTVRYFMEKKRATVLIEEPEQNLSPKAQKETVEYIIEHVDDQSSVFMMTHSPYILTALNNLILANDVKEQKGDKAIKGLVEQKHCVKFEEVSAYTIRDGCSVNIMDQEDRLIGVNVIDAISDEVSETFNSLLSKLD